jgi:hypothetical protein
VNIFLIFIAVRILLRECGAIQVFELTSSVTQGNSTTEDEMRNNQNSNQKSKRKAY